MNKSDLYREVNGLYEYLKNTYLELLESDNVNPKFLDCIRETSEKLTQLKRYL